MHLSRILVSAFSAFLLALAGPHPNIYHVGYKPIAPYLLEVLHPTGAHDISSQTARIFVGHYVGYVVLLFGLLYVVSGFAKSNADAGRG